MRQQNLAVNTAMRYIRMLTLIPEYPGKISTSQLLRKLQEDKEKYGVTQRSVQRDLQQLADNWDISYNNIGRKKYWYFNRKAAFLQIPTMSDSSALILRMAEEHLSDVLPDSAIEFLQGYFRKAKAMLKNTKLGAWGKKVKIIRKGPTLTYPKVSVEIQQEVHAALLNARQLLVTYRNRDAEVKSYPLNPLGLVCKDGAMYLIATAWNMESPAQYALHRMLRAEQTGAPVVLPKAFDLEDYISIAFAYPLSSKMLKLRVRFSTSAGLHLVESRLSADQVIKELPSDAYLLTATVPDTLELRWWLRAFGPFVEVLGPQTLRREFANEARKYAELYCRNDKL